MLKLLMLESIGWMIVTRLAVSTLASPTSKKISGNKIIAIMNLHETHDYPIVSNGSAKSLTTLKGPTSLQLLLNLKTTTKLHNTCFWIFCGGGVFAI